MERGWDATGLLALAWARVGGRDALAALTRILPGTLSGYNTGRLRLGLPNAERIAEATGVSVFDLGAPAEAVMGRPEYQPFLDRLEEVEDLLNRLLPRVDRLAKEVAVLKKREPPTQRRGGSRG